MGSLNKNKNQTFSKVYKETGPAPVRWSRRWRLSGGMTGGGGGGGGEQRRAGPARGGGGGSHQSAGHHHLLLLLTNSRLGTARFHLEQRADTQTGTGPGGQETRSGTCRIRDPAAGSRHAGHGEDGRPRSSGLERILQRGGRSPPRPRR